MSLFYQPLIPEGTTHLDAEESKHCIRVLRKSKGDPIRVTDGAGFFYDAIIVNPDPQKCTFQITSKTPEETRNFTIHIAISPTKNPDRMEWFVEKSVEIGIDKITFVNCKNTERPYLKTDRIQKVSVSAMKQSIKAKATEIQGITSISDIIRHASEVHKFIAFVDSSNPNHLKNFVEKNSSYLILIGPEGDFTKEELQLAMENDFQKVSLGNSRLRTETAGVAACHIFNLFQ